MNSDSNRVVEILSVHVYADGMTVSLKDAEGQEVKLTLPTGKDKELVHIMADALQARESEGFDRRLGHLLAYGQLQPIHFEPTLEALGLQEAFEVTMASPGATTVKLRMREKELRHWIDATELQLAQREKPKLQS